MQISGFIIQVILFSNSSFEEYGEIFSIDNWDFEYGAFNPIRTAEKHSGNYALEFQGQGSFDNISMLGYYFTNLVYNNNYRLDFWAKNMTNEEILFILGYQEGDNSYFWNFYGPNANSWVLGSGPNENNFYSVTLNNTWNKYSIPQIIAPDKNVSLIIASISTNVYLDDVNFYNVNNSNNVILNPGFENWTATDYNIFNHWFFDGKIENFSLETDLIVNENSAVKFKGYDKGSQHRVGSLKQKVNLNTNENYDWNFLQLRN